MMRVTEGSASRNALVGLQTQASRLADLQSQLSSGRQITKPSDNPVGTVSALQLRTQLKQNTQYAANGTDGMGWLTTVDNAYSSINSQLQQVRTLVLQGMNTGAASAGSNQALAQQVDAARSGILSEANASYLGRPVFGGTTASSVAFDSTGTYVGDSGTVSRTIDANTNIDINTPGTTPFGPNGNNVFDLLSTISSDLVSNPSALSGDLSALDSRMSAISSDQALSGAKYSRIQSVQTANSSNNIQLQSQLSDLQDIDLANMAVQVSTASASYQAALATTAKISQTSLLDFLR